MSGISYEQANVYCRWRNRLFSKGQFNYRLPSVEEWKIIALKTLSEKEQKAGLKDSLHTHEDGKQHGNYNYYQCLAETNDYVGSLYPTGNFPAQKPYYIFDLFGNVSEMTCTKGIAKGGSFMVFAGHSNVDSLQYYHESEAWLGFRCIATSPAYLSTGDNTSKANACDTFSLPEAEIYLKDSRDGKTYRTITIGSQTWMAENLAYKPDSGKFWPYLNNENYADAYGYFYSWSTAQNVCPNGWHLPDKQEYLQLIQQYPETEVAYQDLLVTGHSGFNIIPSSAFWTSTLEMPNDKWSIIFSSPKYKRIRPSNDYSKNACLPIRCIKN
jgi:hypothetical protein